MHTQSSRTRTRELSRWRCLFLLLFGIAFEFHLPLAAEAQCVGDLRAEMRVLERFVASLIKEANDTSNHSAGGSAGANGASTLYSRARVVLDDRGRFYSVIGSEAPTSTCLLDRWETFRETARQHVERAGDSLNEEQFDSALREANAAVLAGRYVPTERVGLLFGIGFSGLTNLDRPEIVKVVQRDTGDARTSYIVSAESRRTGPVALTGLAVRFRESSDLWLIPTTAFGSIQLGSGEDLRGTALGVGWPLAGDAHVVVGLNLARTSALRSDLVKDFRYHNRLLELPFGESEETIIERTTSTSVTIALAVPIGLRSAFGQSR